MVPDAPGSAVNVALPPGTDDSGWLRAFHAVVPHALRAFEPTVLVTQHGCDSHRSDPFAHLMLIGRRAARVVPRAGRPGPRGHRRAVGRDRRRRVRDRRRRAAGMDPPAGGRGRAAARSVDADAADVARSRARARSAGAPRPMTDGVDPVYKDWSGGYDPDDWLDRSVLATRKASSRCSGSTRGPSASSGRMRRTGGAEAAYPYAPIT